MNLKALLSFGLALLSSALPSSAQLCSALLHFIEFLRVVYKEW